MNQHSMHGGRIFEASRQTGRPINDWLDFSANLNPAGPPPWLTEEIIASVNLLTHYPDTYCTTLRETLSAESGLPTEAFLAGNGVTELLYLLPRALGWNKALILSPTYADYAWATVLAGGKIVHTEMSEDHNFSWDPQEIASTYSEVQPDAIFVCNPNNPTGYLAPRENLEELIRLFPKSVLVVDESFLPLTDTPSNSLCNNVIENKRLIILRSLTKCFAIPGLRIGYLCAHPTVIARVKSFQEPWSVNTIAQQVAIRALHDKAYLTKSRQLVGQYRANLISGLQQTIPQMKIYPAKANFILIRISETTFTAEQLAEELFKQGVLVRTSTGFIGLEPAHYLRLAVRPPDEVKRLIMLLAQITEGIKIC